MVYPRFSPHSFWNYQATCEVVGARYSAAPLGLITVAALLPGDWQIRLVNRNTEEIEAPDLAWADLVMTGGMLPQQLDALRVVAIAHAHGVPVAVGGPDVTASPHVYEQAEFRVLGEAEEVIDDFICAWRAGMERGEFAARQFPDIRKSPVPRFDLLKLDHYMHVGVQISRGCPFTCEFCNVIELNGRTPRVKTEDQMIAELEALYALGYRGHVDFVDDNLIGNRKAVKPLLRRLAGWLEERRYPFEFSTEASINIAEDDELLALMKRANFFAIFVGIETPDAATLVSTGKRQNVRRDIVQSIRTIYRAGIFVNAGFIIGFDGETGPVAEEMIHCIEEAAIPVCMVGLLYALPNTRLFRRLHAEGRLHAESDRPRGEEDSDQCTSGLNYTTIRPRREMIEDYRTVLKRIYEPRAFFARVSRLARQLDLREHKIRRPLSSLPRDLRSFGRITWRVGILDRDAMGAFWRALGDCLVHNPRAARVVFSQAALYLHLRPFAALLDARLVRRMDAPGTTEVAADFPARAPAIADGAAVTVTRLSA
ncbi:MAG: B12-binding domain-containing radical SAM protein [Candidatus Eisenbacteria bacterium]